MRLLAKKVVKVTEKIYNSRNSMRLLAKEVKAKAPVKSTIVEIQ